VIDRGILVLTAPAALAGPVADVAARSPGGEVVADLDDCVRRLQEHRPAVVVVDHGWSRPMSAARQLRLADPEVGLVLAVPAAETDSVRAKLAFLPDVSDVGVVTSDAGVDELLGQLDEFVSSSRRRQQLRGALDAINRNLAGVVTARHPAGAAVSERYLAALVRHAADTIVSTDATGRIVTINEAGQHTFGVVLDEVEGWPLQDLLAADDPGRLVDLLEGAGSGEAQIDHELPVRLRDGRQLLLSATAAGVRDETDRLAGLVLIARDITAQRQTEQQLRALQKAESLATLASGVAHDFNNLLVQIQGWADVARRAADDADLVAGALENILVATDQAAGLARAMLAYGGRGEFQPERLQLDDLLASVRPLLEASIPSKIRLELEGCTDADEIEGDPTQLRQVVLNLVGNAIEAIGDGPGRITVRTGTEDRRRGGPTEAEPALPPGRYAYLEVADSGPGIDPEHHDRLFDPFFTTKFTGRGLGLAASQGIARAHDGLIVVASPPGGGARFRLLLPTSPRGTT
jgi:PAS domain S-box-containing protein